MDEIKPIRPGAQPKVEGDQALSAEQIDQVMKMRAEKQEKKRVWLWGVVIFAAIFLLFASLVVFLLSQGTPETNPFLKLLGIQTLNRQAILLTISNIGFGLLSFVVFLISIVNLFKAGFSQKDPLVRRRSFIVAALSGFFLIFLLFAWIFTYFNLSQGLAVKQEKPTTLSFKTVPAEAINLTAPVTVEFDASEIQADPAVFSLLSHSWDFGDGEKGTGKITAHTFSKKGTGEYVVVLTIKALNKKTQETVEQQFRKIITVQNEKVKAAFKADPVQGPVPLKVIFDASESQDPDGEIVSYEWDFDQDKEFDDATGVKVEKEFAQIGKFTVRLRVTDNNNDSAVAEKEVIVENPNKLSGAISIQNNPSELLAGRNYEFSGEQIISVFGPITSYEWNFDGGGNKKTGKKVNHAFSAPGGFEVLLLARDSEGNISKFTKTVTVKLAAGSPLAVIRTNPPATPDGIVIGELPLTVQFNASESTDSDNDIAEYDWDTDDDGEADKFGSNVSATFEKAGDNEVTLKVIDADGNIGTAKTVIRISDPGLKAKISANPPDGNVPLTVSFDASGSSYYQGRLVSYEWDFGDGTPKILGDALIKHEYAKIGGFEAQVTAIAADGKRASAKININIRPVSLQACYTANNVTGPAPLIVTFEPRCSTGTISEYRWDFGYDGKTSRQRKPTHTFDLPGTYEVILTVAEENSVVASYKSVITVTSSSKP